MAKKSASVRDMGDAELVDRLAEAKQELFNLRFQIVTGQLDNSARIKAVRREIARILTVLREKEIEAAESAEAGENA